MDFYSEARGTTLFNIAAIDLQCGSAAGRYHPVRQHVQSPWELAADGPLWRWLAIGAAALPVRH
jgi:hypothetical protein